MHFSSMLYGGDYNPEQWPEETWAEDARLMREAGVNLVSLGIFSWARLEPQPGRFDFDWLDRLMGLLYAHGVSANLATPTASPPPWLVRLHPDILPVTAEGVTLWHGSRRHYCPHNPRYHEYADRIALELARRYQDHPSLAMWHVDNEYGCHIGECFCDVSAQSFRAWLLARYGSLQTLNQAWGTAFWGQLYGDWEEIYPPRRAPAYVNPTQQLDWARFSSDSWLDCFTRQRDILKAVTPGVPVTTNFMGFHKPVDYFKFAPQEDVVSNDSYPDTGQADWPMQAAMVCDLIRSVGGGRPWVLMEQAASQVNWRPRNAPKRPGVMRLGSYQAAARGADGVMFFQWRQSLAGAEKHHSAMLPHAGTDSRTWREVKTLGNELPRLKALLGSQVESQAAVLFDWENWWALELDSKPSVDLKILPQVAAIYRYFYEHNITLDFAHPAADLSRYSLVIVPALYLVTDTAAENINAYVHNGGTLLMSYFSGIVDENEHIRPGGYPAPFRKLMGMWVEEYAAYPLGQTNVVLTDQGRRLTCLTWSDVIRLEGAQPLAAYEADYYAGLPAITQNPYGKGQGYYLGTQLEPGGLDWLLDRICQDAGLNPVTANIPAGVEAVRRRDGERSWLFLLNHSSKEVNISLDAPGKALLSGVGTGTSITLEANGVEIIAEGG